MRHELHNFTTIAPVTVYHQGSYVETYSRFKPGAVKAASPVLNGGDEETSLCRPRLVATQLACGKSYPSWAFETTALKVTRSIGAWVSFLHFQPFPGLRADDGGHGAEIAHDKAQRVDGVAAGDGQSIGAHLSVPLPGPVGGPFQDPLLDPTDVTRHDCPNLAGLHQCLGVQQGRSSPGL